MSYAVRIHYPGRAGKAGKKDLVVAKPTRVKAVAYARKVAARGFRKVRGKAYGTKANAPIACIYNLTDWGQRPLCFKAVRPTGWQSSGRPAVVSQRGLGGLRRRRRR